MRTFFTSVVGLIVILVLVGVIAVFIGWSRVPDVIAKRISQKLGVATAIESIQLGLGKITIKNVEIANPAGTVQPQAFTCKDIEIKTPLSHYLQRQIVIDEIDVNAAFLDLEFDSPTATTGNWSRIMGNLERNAALSSPSTPKKQTSKSPRSVLIRKLVLTNIDVDVLYLRDGGKVIHLPRIDRIELYDISSEGGLPMDQIMNSVLGEMLKSVFVKENLKNMLQDLIQNPPKGLQKLLSPFKNLF